MILQKDVHAVTCGSDDDWLAERMRTIGGSDAAAAAGKSQWKSRRVLYGEIHRVLVEGLQPRPKAVNDGMRRGARLEPAARDILADVLGVSVEKHDPHTILRNPEFPWAHSNPDGWLCEDPVELKVPWPATIARVAMHGLTPEQYHQCQHTMAVVRAGRIHFCMLDPLSAIPYHYTIPRDDAFIADMMEAERDLYERIKRSEPPEDVAAEPDEFADEAIQIDTPEAINLAEQWFRLRRVVDESTDVLGGIKSRLIAIAGEKTKRFNVGSVGRFNHITISGRRSFRKADALAELERLRKLVGETFDPAEFHSDPGKPGRQFRSRAVDPPGAS